MIKVVLVDDHQMVVEGISYCIQESKYLHLIKASSDPVQIRDQTDWELVDVLITDIKMEPFNGVELAEYVRSQNSRIKIVALSMYSLEECEATFNMEVFDGFVPKGSAFQLLNQTVVNLMNGKKAPTWQKSTSPLEDLTEKQKAIIRLLPQNKNYVELAKEVGVSYNTLRSHVQQIYIRLGVNNRASAVIEAQKFGLFD